jgi:hypothetical protein
MFVLAKLLLVHEVFHHLLFVVLALIKLHGQLLPIYLFVVQAVECVHGLRLILERDQGVSIFDYHIADDTVRPKNLFKVF